MVRFGMRNLIDAVSFLPLLTLYSVRGIHGNKTWKLPVGTPQLPASGVIAPFLQTRPDLTTKHPSDVSFLTR